MTLFIQAANYTPSRTERVRLAVIHCTVSPEGSGTARAIANYFASENAGGSAHWVFDPTETVQCVRLKDTAWHAPPANPYSIGYEICGLPTQTREQWLDANSSAAIARCAARVRQDCVDYGIPLIRLSNDQLAFGHAGIVSHKQVSDVFGQSSHWDPGPEFPWDVFLDLLNPPPPELGDLMWLAKSSDGRWFSGNAVEKTYVNHPETLDFLKRAGAKDMGVVSSIILNEFPTKPAD